MKEIYNKLLELGFKDKTFQYLYDELDKIQVYVYDMSKRQIYTDIKNSSGLSACAFTNYEMCYTYEEFEQYRKKYTIELQKRIKEYDKTCSKMTYYISNIDFIYYMESDEMFMNTEDSSILMNIKKSNIDDFIIFKQMLNLKN